MKAHADNAFDKIRWIAATAVLLSHSFPLIGLPEPMICGDSLGKLAVMVFFAVSGYLVCQSWDRDPNLLRFTQRRALRIMPGLVVAVLVTTLGIGAIATTLPVGVFMTDRATWDYVASNALLVAGVERVPGTFVRSPETIFNGSLWTLRYEVAMYAILAFGARFVRLRDACVALFVAGLVALSWLSWRGVGHYSLPLPGLWKIGLQFDAVRLLKLGTTFFCAASLYVLRDRIVLRWRHAVVLVVVLTLGASSPFVNVLLALTVPYVTLVIALKSPPALRQAWSNDLSYGIYVYAYPVQQLVSQVAREHELGWPWAFGISLLATLVLAALSWKVVEQPALRHKPRRHLAMAAAPSG
jgi:peptidoglycan/LPS O-acetylase OafA/YrhL